MGENIFTWKKPIVKEIKKIEKIEPSFQDYREIYSLYLDGKNPDIYNICLSAHAIQRTEERNFTLDEITLLLLTKQNIITSKPFDDELKYQILAVDKKSLISFNKRKINGIAAIVIITVIKTETEKRDSFGDKETIKLSTNKNSEIL